MAGQITQAEADVIAEAILAGKIARGDSVEVLAGVFLVGAIENRAGDIHVTMLGTRKVERVNVEFRVGGMNA